MPYCTVYHLPAVILLVCRMKGVIPTTYCTVLLIILYSSTFLLICASSTVPVLFPLSNRTSTWFAFTMPALPDLLLLLNKESGST